MRLILTIVLIILLVFAFMGCSQRLIIPFTKAWFKELGERMCPCCNKIDTPKAPIRNALYPMAWIADTTIRK